MLSAQIRDSETFMREFVFQSRYFVLSIYYTWIFNMSLEYFKDKRDFVFMFLFNLHL